MLRISIAPPPSWSSKSTAKFTVFPAAWQEMRPATFICVDWVSILSVLRLVDLLADADRVAAALVAKCMALAGPSTAQPC
jgi:hypothetical protein